GTPVILCELAAAVARHFASGVLALAAALTAGAGPLFDGGQDEFAGGITAAGRIDLLLLVALAPGMDGPGLIDHRCPLPAVGLDLVFYCDMAYGARRKRRRR